MASNEEIIHKKNTEAAQGKLEKAKALDAKLLNLKATYNDLVNTHVEVKVGHPNRVGFLEMTVLNGQKINNTAMDELAREFVTKLANEIETQIIETERELATLFNIK